MRGRRVAILGATLWTDYAANGDTASAMATAARMLNDHWLIRHDGTRFSPEYAAALHHETRAWLEREMPRARGEADAAVIMTHHAPLTEANPAQFQGGPLAPAFVSDLRADLDRWQPDLWVWGHTHHSMRTQIGRTVCVSAQRGYLGQEDGAESFVPLVVTI